MLRERGIVVANDRRHLETFLTKMLGPAKSLAILSERNRHLIRDMRLKWGDLDRRKAAFTAEFVAPAREDAARRFVSIPSFGALNATALVAAIGTGETFRSGRDLAARLGLVQRQEMAGRKPRLLGITKRGDTCPRALLICRTRRGPTSLSAGPTGIAHCCAAIGRARKNKVVVAFAGKLARSAWALLRSGESYAVRAPQPSHLRATRVPSRADGPSSSAAVCAASRPSRHRGLPRALARGRDRAEGGEGSS